ncbi:MAG: helix-turn-helix domain-containing protein [Clostridia bacterium]|nr:helix-turn-helix domain-containing protein [Clostridia bacterium]
MIKNHNEQNLLGKKIADCRIRKNLTQAELGKLTGMNSTTISNYEIGYSFPRVDKLQIIADVLGEDIAYFLSNDISSNFRSKNSQIPFQNTIAFYKNSNINGMLCSPKLHPDSYMVLPSIKKYDTRYLFGTEVEDNSVINEGIPAGSYVIINPNAIANSGDTVAVIDKIKKSLIIRVLNREGPVIHLTANGYGNHTPIITRDTDTDYTILGPVVGKILKN